MPPRRSNRIKKTKNVNNFEVAAASSSPVPLQTSENILSNEATQSGGSVPSTNKPLRRSKRYVQSKTPVQPFVNEHQLDEEIYNDLFVEINGNLEEDDDHLPASGVSIEAAHLSAFPAAASVDPSPTSYPCEHCSSVLKTKHGIAKHLMAHRFKECNSKRPSAAILEPLMENFSVQCFTEIASEHGEEKKNFVEVILQVSASGCSEWTDFVSVISDPILESVSRPTKLLPANQYEEQLVSLNKLLNNEEKISPFLEKLMSLNASSSNCKLGKMILFRLLTKLVDKTVHFVFSEMRGPQLEHVSTTDINSDVQEATAFYFHIRMLLQKYYVKGLSHGSKLWLARCACIRQRFVECLEVDSSPSVEDIISNDGWVEDENGIVKLKLEPRILKYFAHLESIVESLIVSDQSVNADSVLNILLSKGNHLEMLELWHSLTSPYLSELESLLFMKDIVSVLCNLSLRLEVGRDRDITSKVRIQKYALRTDLKRN